MLAVKTYHLIWYSGESTGFGETPYYTPLSVMTNKIREVVQSNTNHLKHFSIKKLRQVMKRKKEMTKRGNNNKVGSNAEINKLKKITVMSMNYMNTL
jgi:hypothetical protein